MALTSYDGLLSEIPVWANRVGDTEFAASAPTFVLGCEQMLNYGTDALQPLRIGDMEVSDTVFLTDGEGDLPDDFLEWRQVTTGDLPYQLLSLGTPDSNQYAYGSSGSGIASRFDIVGSTIKTYPPSASDVSLSYYAKIPALSANRQTNWLLRKAPFVYLYGSLIQTAPFMQDDERIVTWMGLFNQAVNGLINSDKRARFSRSVSRVSGPTP